MSDATTTEPLPEFTPRRCRGHWHVVRSGSEDELGFRYLPFMTQEQAQARADMLNMGGTFKEADDLFAPPVAAPASTPAPAVENAERTPEEGR